MRRQVQRGQPAPPGGKRPPPAGSAPAGPPGTSPGGPAAGPPGAHPGSPVARPQGGGPATAGGGPAAGGAPANRPPAGVPANSRPAGGGSANSRAPGGASPGSRPPAPASAGPASAGPPARARRRGGLFASLAVVAVLVVSIGAAALTALWPQRVAGLVGAPRISWHRGTPAGPPPAVLAGVPGDAAQPTEAGVATALTPLLTDPALGDRVTVSVLDVQSGQKLFERGAGTPTLPASTAKLVTAAAALSTRGPTYRITTRVVGGRQPGDVVLVGGGDPTLAAGTNGTYAGAARLDDLAAQVKRSLGDTRVNRVVIDTSLFTGPVFGPGWDVDIPTGGFGAAITPLMIDGARSAPVSPHGAAARSPQPDLVAGQAFAAALGLPASSVTRGSAPADAKPLGEVQSAPLLRLVEYMLSESDNVIAECLARQVALARGEPASFTGGATATKAVLTELGLPAGDATLADGSGLSRSDRLTPALLTGVLALAAKADHPELRSVFSGMPVAGYSGTLRDRYRDARGGAAAAGLVRAKTGTLSAVSTIAGIAIDVDGRVLAFAVLADAVPADVLAAAAALDRIAAALAGCGCR